MTEAIPVEDPEGNESLTQKQIRKQVEWFFSDRNLHIDPFLRELILKEAEGYVNLAIISGLNSIKKLTSDITDIVAALRASSKLQVSEDNSAVRRVQPLPDRLGSDDAKFEQILLFETLPEGYSWKAIKFALDNAGLSAPFVSTDFRTNRCYIVIREEEDEPVVDAATSGLVLGNNVTVKARLLSEQEAEEFRGGDLRTRILTRRAEMPAASNGRCTIDFGHRPHQRDDRNHSFQQRGGHRGGGGGGFRGARGRGGGGPPNTPRQSNRHNAFEMHFGTKDAGADDATAPPQPASEQQTTSEQKPASEQQPVSEQQPGSEPHPAPAPSGTAADPTKTDGATTTSNEAAAREGAEPSGTENQSGNKRNVDTAGLIDDAAGPTKQARPANGPGPGRGAPPRGWKGQAGVPADGPMVIRGARFQNRHALKVHVRKILKSSSMGQPLPGYESAFMRELLSNHSSAKDKLRDFKAIMVISHPEHHSPCFAVLRTDGSREDFSYLKCVDAVPINSS